MWKALGGVEASQQAEENEPTRDEDEEEVSRLAASIELGMFSVQRTQQSVVSTIQIALEH